MSLIPRSLSFSMQAFNSFRIQNSQLPRKSEHLVSSIVLRLFCYPLCTNMLISSFPSKITNSSLFSHSIYLSCFFHIIMTRSRAVAHIFNHHLNTTSQLRSPRPGHTARGFPPCQNSLAWTYIVTTLQHFLHHLFPPLSACPNPTNTGIPGSRASYTASSSSLFGSGHAKHEKHTSR